MFLPPGDNPRCATYIRKSLNLHPKVINHDGSGILAITVKLNDIDLEILNVYAPRAKKATQFLTTHSPQSNTIMAGDFNSHHAIWYADKATDYEDSIRNSRKDATFLTSWTETHSFQLVITLGTFTHFPHSTHRPSIIDLTFARGLAIDICEEWSCDPGSGGSSDHALTITALNIATPQYVAKRVHQRTKWDIFERIIKQLPVPESSWDTKESTLQMAEKINKQIQVAIDKSVPWSKPSRMSRRWWTPELSRLKTELAHLKKQTRAKPDTAEG